MFMNAQTLALEVPRQKIDFKSFDSLSDLLKLSGPPFGSDHFRQLNFIERHLGRATPKCLSVIIERYYIDRDFMDDYSVFYSTNLYPYPNWCQRIHFFSLDKDQVQKNMRNLSRLGAASEIDNGNLDFKSACQTFSREAYMGFSVIKPLQGSPVGRTVIRHYKEDTGKGLLRKFNCTRYYKVHLLGIELEICGLVFQQQDMGVSACASTALWSSLSKTKDFEDISTPTPAQITRLASQYLLSAGRPMPSEGLTLEQMCQAVQSVQASANVLKVENLTEARGYLHSAISSGFAPVLLLEEIAAKPRGHAVTVAGMKVRSKHRATMISDRIDDEAGDLESLYINDDRSSPYFRVDLPKRGNKATLSFKFLDDYGQLKRLEKWRLSHILIPMHGKIRLSFAALRELAVEVVDSIVGYRGYYTHDVGAIDVGTIQLRIWIRRAPTYVHHLFYGKQKIQERQRDDFNRRLILSRYVGVVRLTSDRIGILDILFDTTSTKKNPHCLGVVARIPNEYFASALAKFLSIEFKCPLVTDVR
jgi:hypothetical protein